MSLKQSGIESDWVRLPNRVQMQRLMSTAFENSTQVLGAFGWMDAGWIPIVAHGLHAYIRKESSTPIVFTIAPWLFSKEYTVLQRFFDEPGSVTENDALEVLIKMLDEGVGPDSPEVMRHTVRVFCWLIANDLMRIRIALPKPGSNFHPKVWYFTDGHESVVVDGSANATGRGVTRGIEHVDVSTSWEGGTKKCSKARAWCEDWANGRDDALHDTVTLTPAVLRDRVKSFASEKGVNIIETPTLDGFPEVDGPELPESRKPLRFSIPAYVHWDPRNPHHAGSKFLHQGHAVHAWEEADRRGMYAVATGGGKTIAALISAQRLYKERCIEHGEGPFFLVVTAPNKPLINQWKREASEFGVDLIAPTFMSKKTRKARFGDMLARLHAMSNDEVVALILTNDAIVNRDYTQPINDAIVMAKNVFRRNPVVLHVGDEAHTLGREQFIEDPPTFADYRLGLSATPIRQYDPDGTSELMGYFRPEAPEQCVVSEFTLEEAISSGALVRYNYHLDTVDLTPDEMDRYAELTIKIGRMKGMGLPESAIKLKRIERRRVLETASNKTSIWFINKIRSGADFRRTLIYCSSKGPEQFDAVHELLHAHGISHRQVTQETTAKEATLVEALDAFDRGEVDVLIAKQVLDEGLNIPATKTAFLVGSSTTSREWVQRVGRVLRTAPGKTFADVHDVIALPPVELSDRTSGAIGVIKSETARARRIGQTASNLAEVLRTVDDIEGRYLGRNF